MTDAAKLTLTERDDGGAPAGIENIQSVSGRANALLQSIGQEALAVDSPAAFIGAGDDDDDSDDGDAQTGAPMRVAAPSAKAPVPNPDAEATPADPRAKRLAESRELERGRAEQRRAAKSLEDERAAIAREREEMQQALREIEPYRRAMKDPLEFVELAKERLDPTALAGVLPTLTSDEQMAKWRQKTAGDSLLEQVKALLDERLGPVVETLKPIQADRIQQRQQSVYATFDAEAKALAEHYPAVAKLIERNPTRAHRMADAFANELGDDYTGPNAESFRLVIQKIHEELFADDGQPSQSPAGTSHDTSRQRHAAGKANPLGNRASSERTMIKGPNNEEQASSGPESMDARVKRAMRELDGVPVSKLMSR